MVVFPPMYAGPHMISMFQSHMLKWGAGGRVYKAVAYGDVMIPCQLCETPDQGIVPSLRRDTTTSLMTAASV